MLNSVLNASVISLYIAQLEDKVLLGTFNRDLFFWNNSQHSQLFVGYIFIIKHDEFYQQVLLAAFKNS